MNLLERAIHRPRTLTARRWLFQVHLWTGIFTGLYAILIGISGSILVFRDEITDAATHQWKHVSPAATPTPPDDWLQAVRQATGYNGLIILDMPQRPEDSAQATFYTRNAAHSVFLNPYTSAIIGQYSSEGTLLRFIEGLHSNFFLQRTGRLINGILGLLLLLLAITGIVIWWPGPVLWKRRLTIDFTSRWRRINYDLHNTIGFWGASGLAVLCLTGAYFTWPQFYRNTVAAYFPLTSQRPIGIHSAEGSQPATLAALIQAANAAVPQKPVWRIEIPPGRKAPVRILKLGEGSPPHRTATTIFLHPGAAQPLRVDRYSDRTAGDKIVSWIGPLHTGNFGGLAVKIIYGLLGLVPPLLFLTGFLMWWDRVVKNKWLAAQSSAKERATAA